MERGSWMLFDIESIAGCCADGRQRRAPRADAEAFACIELETGKHNTFAAAFLAALPVTSLMAMLWLHDDTGDSCASPAFAAISGCMVLPSLACLAALLLAPAIAAAVRAHGGLGAQTRSVGWNVY
jgi:hypothetical protein